jgi:hypothetical protein
MKEWYLHNFRWLFRNSLLLSLELFSLILIASCKKDPEPIFTNSVINGIVNRCCRYDSSDNIKVIARGPFGNKTTITDSLGRYSFRGLGNGTYTLEYVKEGYGSSHRYGLQLFGNDSIFLWNFYLFKKIENFNVPGFVEINPHYESPWGAYYIGLRTDMMERNHNLAFFMDLDKNVSYKSYSYINTIVESVENVSSGSMFIFYPGNLPFKSGSTVYLIAYVCNEFELEYRYFDAYYGGLQLTTLQPDNHSEVMSFIMP